MKPRCYIIALSIVLLVIIYINRQRVKKTIVEGIDYMLSKEQESFIAKLHPVAQQKFRTFISEVQKRTGYRIIITSGFRSFAEQANLYAQNSKNAKPGFSFHNYGMAIDINAQNGTTWLRKASSKQSWTDSGIIDIADEMGFRWGGRFSGYADNVHFDLGKDYETASLYNLAVAQYGTNPKNILGNQINIT